MSRTTTQTNFYGRSTSIESYCLAISFTRPSTGTSEVQINGLPLAAGQTLSISQNVGDIDNSRYEIRFDNVGLNELWVVRVLPLDAIDS
jgi:hypothetical protein